MYEIKNEEFVGLRLRVRWIDTSMEIFVIEMFVINGVESLQ